MNFKLKQVTYTPLKQFSIELYYSKIFKSLMFASWIEMIEPPPCIPDKYNSISYLFTEIPNIFVHSCSIENDFYQSNDICYAVVLKYQRDIRKNIFICICASSMHREWSESLRARRNYQRRSIIAQLQTRSMINIIYYLEGNAQRSILSFLRWKSLRRKRSVQLSGIITSTINY